MGTTHEQIDGGLTVKYKLFRGVLGTFLALACWAAPAHADQTCDGREATIVSTDEGADVDGTSGDDVIVVYASEQNGFTIRGFGGDDWICGSSVRDHIYGGDGADTIFASRNPAARWDRNTVYGGEGDDRIIGASLRDSLHGEEGSDVLRGEGGQDYLTGGPGPDHLEGGVQPDSLFGEEGDDLIDAGPNGANLYGEPGDDLYRSQGPVRKSQVSILNYSRSSSEIVADLSAGKVTGESTGKDTLEGRFQIRATDHDDEIMGTAQRDVIWANDGSDEVMTGWGNDEVHLFERVDSAPSEDTVDGSEGIDILYVYRRASFSINLGTGQSDGAGIGSIDGFENLFGESENGSVTLTGDDDPNRLSAGSVKANTLDQVNGAGGDDVISMDIHISSGYGDNPNVASGGEGDDKIFGDDHEDHIEGGAGSDQIWGRRLNDELFGGEGNDTIYAYVGEDVVEGGTGEDTLYGGWHDDILRGGDGNDVLYGDEYNDQLEGNGGDDQLFGGLGPTDFLDGGEDVDQLNGGTGGLYSQYPVVAPEDDTCLNGETLAECEHTSEV
jgi:Ca2+-binding RTX toxin-like protein